MYKNAGKEIHILSLTFILTSTPANIKSESPSDEIINIGWYKTPIKSPKAPKISKIMVNSPIFSNPNLLNSFFM